MTTRRPRHTRPFRTSLLTAVLIVACGAPLVARPSAAAQVPYAVFDRLVWAPDGHAVALQATLMSADFSSTEPVRVDTLVVDPETGRGTCVTPRVEAFALSPSADSLLFADAYGLYIMPFPAGPVRQVVWRRPAGDIYIRRLAFAQGGGYLINTACFTDLSVGCNEQWPVPVVSQRTALPDLRLDLVEGQRQPKRTGLEPLYVRDWARRKTPMPFDSPEHRTALLRGLVRTENLAPGRTPLPKVEVRFARPLGDERYWFASVAVHRKRPWLSRAYTLVYVPLLKEVRPIAQDVATAFLPLGTDGFAYNTLDGHLWNVRMEAGRPTRTRVATSQPPEWTRTLGPAVTLFAARAAGLDTPTKAEELAASLIMQGYHAWPVPDGSGKWGVSVGWYGARAEAESANAVLVGQGYDSQVLEARPTELKGTRISRPARGVTLRAPAGPLAGSEAILDYAGSDEYAASALFLRRSGETARIVVTGCTDEAPETRTAQTPPTSPSTPTPR